MKAKRRPSARVFWLKQLHTWHWVSAAISLIGMMLFAITGITLNHAASIGAEPKVTQGAGQLAAPLIAELKKTPASGAPIPNAVADEVQHLVKLDTHGKSAEWSEDEVYVALPGPGRDAWVSVDRASGAVTSELTDRGWISYLNDLHKGRNTGSAWFWFIDVFAVACILFTITGFFLLQLHARHRPSTWPLVGLGLLVPALLAVLFIH
ncbi:PepSY-associated TM helix domain-containing protein [Sphingobium nicotianae]|uniref:PepSY-associated TM helix domain-containing protein n=1 Tax=Sphingobium nicotianae TaxID=2782607 RepID=UPI0032D98403